MSESDLENLRKRISVAKDILKTKLPGGYASYFDDLARPIKETATQPGDVEAKGKKGGGKKPSGGRPSNEDSPSRKKQRWCYDQYTDQKKKKLSRILEAGKKEFGKKAPKSEGEIITYAQRWAKFKNLPIPRRN